MNAPRGPGEAALPAPWLRISAELALVALTVAGVLGLARLFDDASFLGPVLGFALGGHALAGACRYLGLRPGVSAAVAAAGLALALSWFLLPETTTLGLPGPGTWSQAASELADAMVVFRQVVAPAPVEPGFVLAAAVAVWVSAVVADGAAMRAGARVEAAIPAATLFVFGAALAAPGGRLALTAVFLAALALYWLTQRLLIHAEAPNRMSSGAGTAPRSLLWSGAGLAAAALLAAVLVGPLLPGAEASAVVPWRSGDRDGGGSRVTVSPLVDIRSRIVDQSDIEVFTVRSDTRSYWRLTSLEIFDGRIWSSRGQYREVDGALPAPAPDRMGATRRSVADVEISNLSSIWLPAPYRPVSIEGTDARFDPDSSSLLTEASTAAGLTYRVQSEILSLDAGALAAVAGPVPDVVAASSTALPPDFSPGVVDEAVRITAGASSPYEAARLLQDSFRDGSFTYDLSIAPGHGGDDLERFLFATRRGYCEQFAGAFAAMARAVGLPARVAVGFTTGEQDQTGAFRVRGLNAHAWPEVYLRGYGWVAFEPTPGRGIPGAESYTGVPEQQAAPGAPATATTRPLEPAPAPPTTAAAAPAASPSPEAPGRSGEDPSPWPGRIAVAAGLFAAALGSWWALLAGLRRRRRRRHRAGATTPADRVLVTWAEVGESLAQLGHPPRPSETPTEFAQRAAGATGIDHRLLGALAGVTTAAGYGPHGVDGQAAGQAARAAADVISAVDEQLGVRARLARALD
ncbi:MAG TPA: DUF3488 and transglutaminase-like domain-containing protein, partial [Acidimicrobiales bacterium]|nr:DUF3488 and transglutaminase-like domain-containing protein [Acidimicrobiales bacterium]